MPNQPSPPLQQLAVEPQLTYVDRPEISETCADSLARAWRDASHNVRMEFVVNRLDDPAPPAAPTGKALTACRLVIPLSGMIDLHAKLGALIGMLQQQGVLKPIVQPQTSGRPN
jgi:hypothetical protein